MSSISSWFRRRWEGSELALCGSEGDALWPRPTTAAKAVLVWLPLLLWTALFGYVIFVGQLGKIELPAVLAGLVAYALILFVLQLSAWAAWRAFRRREPDEEFLRRMRSHTDAPDHLLFQLREVLAELYCVEPAFIRAQDTGWSLLPFSLLNGPTFNEFLENSMEKLYPMQAAVAILRAASEMTSSPFRRNRNVATLIASFCAATERNWCR